VTQEPVAERYIALVTEDPTFRHIVSTALEREGLPVLACGDERTARELIASTPPAAVVLEVRLGGDISGVGMVKALRRDRATAGIPIVVCSADERLLDLYLLELVHLGCDVLGVPYNFALLRSTIEQAVRRGPLLTPVGARTMAVDELLAIV
jgi:DNA-binding response OmpR family regulator